jgi:hypothetical protein
MVPTAKRALSFEQIDAQTALELPDRDMMALINITVIDVLSGNEVNVQVPIGVAANVCGVQANVLAHGGLQEPVDCTASTTQDLPVAFRP